MELRYLLISLISLSVLADDNHVHVEQINSGDNTSITATQIGFDKVFNVSYEDYEPMAWFENEVFSSSMDDFFAKRPVEYTKHDKSITAMDLF